MNVFAYEQAKIEKQGVGVNLCNITETQYYWLKYTGCGRLPGKMANDDIHAGTILSYLIGLPATNLNGF